ncbi:MAG: hypothetical protein LBC98_06265, partial [Prevotellaceae bacterium]|nr:hypothetical protein [Prevotellaceae bacterium]
TNLSLTSDAEIETLALYHRKTGEALQNVSIKLYATKDWSKPVGSLIKTLYSNKNGKANISSDKDNYLSCALLESKGETVYIPQVQYFTQNKHQPGSEVYMFTDRAIYRPGQTVFFKGLVLDKTVEKTEINTEKQTVTVCLRDVNSKEIAKADFKVNEYGTFNGNFAIPQGLLNGVMRLETVGKHAYNNHTIRVEEYKRPTFEVKIKAPKQEIAMNSSISLKATAKALAGYAIDGAAVKYEVTRTAVMPFWRYYFMPYPYSAATQRQIASGTATTNENGEFTIDFVTKADDVKIDELIYNFTVTATVTDLNGETRSANYVLKASKKPLLIEAEIPDYIDVASKTNFGLKTTNLNGDSVSCRIEIKAERLKTPSRITRKRLWQTPDTMLMSRSEFERLFPYDLYMDEEALPNKLPVIEEVGSFSLNTSEDKEIDLSFLKKYPSGSYKITIKAVSDKGITSETPFYLQSVNGVPNVITRMENWLRKPLETNVKSGETVEFFLAGGDKNARVEYILFNKFAKIIERRTLTPGHTPQKLSIPIKKEYGNKITACFFMVHENRMYNDRTNIWISDTDNQLDITFASFRDKLQPGENEKWTLTIKDKKGDPQLAELVASMYDASLDAFAKHSWKEVLNIFDRFYWSFDLSSSNLNILSGGFNLKRPSTPYFAHPLKRDYINFSKTNEHYYFGSDERLDEVTIVGFGAQRKSSVVGSVGSTSAVSSRSLSVPLSETSKALAGNAYGLMDEASNYENEENMPPVETDEPVLARTNFNETAFFYPELRTNKDGEVVIEFTVPESLTRWKMLGMAHTRDLKIGLVERELITQKEVAISANAPRFFRQGDTLIFTAKVNNITKEKIKGFAEFEFFDALDMQPVDIADEKGSTPFEVDAYQSVVLQKRLIIPEGLQAVTYRVSARAGNHTDGEEKTVPVLTDRILVTESMPFSIRGNQEKSFVFDRLKNQSNTARNHALTLEYTSNPAWYAVQALPYIMEYPYECAEQTFARYYANALASNLMDASPKIKKIFELWKTLPEGKALASNLEKNQELKQALLEETPWALDASNETERKKRIGLLFDLNRMSSESSRALGKLQKMQSSTGGFSWFDGMPDDRYITQHIIVGLRHLEHLTSQNDKVCNEIISKAMNYLDKKIDEDYALDIKHKNADEKTIGISPLQMQYLYLCSFDKRTLKDSKAYDFYMNLAAKQWNKLGIYKQGLAALIMHRAGKGETAQAIVKSLKERARKSEEMGMYWESNRQGYFWYQAPTETQALMIEVFGEVANDAQAVEELRIWLLKNKQTCDWRTTKATSDAIYALLNTPGQPSERAVNLLDGKDVKIKIAGKALTDMLPDELKPEPGTGYVKASWRGEEVKKEMAEIEVSNPNSGIAWGAMYLQYFERLDKITASETKLGLKRKLFVKKQTESGPVLVPIAKQSPKVGDLITVRIELRADRDFEYVHLKDARAAGLEPASFASGYRHQEGLWYYQSMKDASQNFFIGRLLKGVYLFEYDLRVTHRGSFSHGISTIQCMYAPEFTSHSEGVRVNNLDE